MSRYYAYIVAYISRLEIGNVVLRPARLEVGHYDTISGDYDMKFAGQRTVLTCANTAWRGRRPKVQQHLQGLKDLVPDWLATSILAVKRPKCAAC